MFNRAAAVLAILMIAGIAGGVYIYNNLDHIIKVAVEKYGTQATQSEVTLDSVTLSLQSGSGTMSGLSIDNPKGFSSAKAFYLGSISMKVDTSTLTGNGPIVIREIIIDKPQVVYEVTSSGDSNLQAIKRNTQNYASTTDGESAPKQADAAGAPPSSGRKLIINDLIIRNGQVSIDPGELGKKALQGKNLSTDLPDIHLTGIGKVSNGATAAQVAQQVLGSVVTSATRAAATELAKQQLSGLLKNVPVPGGVLGNAVGGVTGSSAGSTIGEHLQGLIGQ